jgi:hypothetical protein
MKKFIFLLCIIFASCSPETFKILPKGPVNHQLVVLAKVDDGIRVRGFSKSTPPKTIITCTIGQDSQEVTSESDGSFDIKVKSQNPAKYAELVFIAPDNQPQVLGYEVKDLSRVLQEITREVFRPGPEISGISFDNNQALILYSIASSVNFFDIGEDWKLKDRSSHILINKEAQTLGASYISNNKNYAIIALYKSNELALLDLSEKKISKSKLKDKTGKLYSFINNPALNLNIPVDAGFGLKNKIDKSLALSPESIIAVDDNRFLVSFSNYYQFADQKNPSVLGPGLLALVSIKNDQIITEDIKELKYKNPMYLLANGDDFWVVCTGPWHIGNTYESHGAGLIKVNLSADKNSLIISHEINLKDFSPTAPSFIDQKIIVPHIGHNEIAVIDQKALEIKDFDIKKSDRPFSFTSASHWYDDIVMLGSDGELVAYSLKDGYLPFPFIEPIKIKFNNQELSRVDKLYFRHQVKNTSLNDLVPGYTAWAVSFGQAKIFALDFLRVFGP